MNITDPVVLLVDILGWLGAALFLFAYYWLSNGKLAADSYSYQLMNLLGGVFLVVNAVYYRAFPSVGVNLVWALITIFAIIRKFSQSTRSEVVG